MRVNEYKTLPGHDAICHWPLPIIPPSPVSPQATVTNTGFTDAAPAVGTVKVYGLAKVCMGLKNRTTHSVQSPLRSRQHNVEPLFFLIEKIVSVCMLSASCVHMAKTTPFVIRFYIVHNATSPPTQAPGKVTLAGADVPFQFDANGALIVDLSAAKITAKDNFELIFA
jgi:hypothetical protein